MAMNRRLLCIFSHIRFLQYADCKQSQVELLKTNITSRRCFSSDDRVITSGKLQVNGVDFHYEQAGNGLHTLLLLPGALGCSQTDFQPQLKGLSLDKYRIIALDPRGYGKSRPPERNWPLLFYQRDAEDCANFMKALEIPRYSVLGWSDGGITGMILAATHPESLQRLAIWGANAYISKVDFELYKQVSNIDQWSARMKQPFIDVYGEEYFRQLWQGWNNAINSYVTQRSGDLCIGSLPNIKCPTLIVNGLKDSMLSQEHPAFLKKHIANSRIVDFPEGKHNLHLRYHKEFNAQVEEFLDEVLVVIT